jgi:hypothetical protein
VNLPIKLRRPLLPLALLSALSLTAGLCLPASSLASRPATRSEERAARAEERSARREQERATRAQEREAARNARGNAQSGESGTPASSEPAGAPLERGCVVSIDAGSTRITAGEAVTLSGALECPISAGAAGRQVPIYERQGPGSFSLVGSATTEADGSYSLTTAALSANTTFLARAGHHRASVAVKVGPGVTLTVVSPATQASTASQSRARTTFTGTVTPAVTGALVALQIAYGASGERWQSVAYAHVAAEGTYTIAHLFKSPGLVEVRTLVHLGRHHAAAASASVPYEVPQPQNPQLSIQASADPLVYGQSVTISGVASGAAGQSVTLLARTGAGAFAEVAKATTEANGDYTFTQSPLQSTYYRVADATTRSTALFEGLAFALTGPAPETAVQPGQMVTFSGTLSPAPAGQIVYLEQEYPSGIGFHVIGEGKLQADSEYAIEQAFSGPATVVLRIGVPGNGQYLKSAGAPLTVTVAG